MLFIYNFYSGGEDSTLRMWNFEGELGKPITLPAQVNIQSVSNLHVIVNISA